MRELGEHGDDSTNSYHDVHSSLQCGQTFVRWQGDEPAARVPPRPIIGPHSVWVISSGFRFTCDPFFFEGLVQKDGARLLLEETTANPGESLVKLEPFFLPPGETLLEQEELSLKPEERRPKLVKTFLPAEETLLEQEEPSLPRPEDLSGQEETSTKAEEDRHNLMEASLQAWGGSP
ncbi:MAG TPA: hypothetical protein VK459_11180 [Polyangiaceae bacterium]|nr:hypothetical protein [Polyangiaceae bacterium]